ncbi:hypothetical protein FRC06_009907 [Ceratobasidium sp. 370]|nr:hypothetical protein FRC06_009907 [Ceratobasidium sp. 370]
MASAERDQMIVGSRESTWSRASLKVWSVYKWITLISVSVIVHLVVPAQLALGSTVFAHCPDPDVPMLEIVRAFSWLINQGKAFYWGTSGWSATQIEEAHHIADQYGLIAPVAEQPCYNAFTRKRVEEEYQHVYERYNYGLTTYSPLDGGFLTGKYNSGEIPGDSRYATSKSDPWISHLRDLLSSDEGKERIAKVKKLEVIANELQTDLATLSLAWVMKNPRVSTIILGATRVSQVQSNLKALDLLQKVSDETYQRISDIFPIDK